MICEGQVKEKNGAMPTTARCLLVAGLDLLQVKAKANWQSEGKEG